MAAAPVQAPLQLARPKPLATRFIWTQRPCRASFNRDRDLGRPDPVQRSAHHEIRLCGALHNGCWDSEQIGAAIMRQKSAAGSS